MQRGIVRRHDDIEEEGLHMGWFSDAFEIGAGATLGSLATVGAVHVGASVLSGIDAKKFAEYRAEHFDPVVFDDLDNLLVHKSLPEIPYPFPDAASAAAEAAGSSWQRKVIVAGLAGSLDAYSSARLRGCRCSGTAARGSHWGDCPRDVVFTGARP